MGSTEDLTVFLEPLAALQRVINRFKQRGVIIGGIAASLLGRPRLTADLDAMLFASIDQIPEILALANNEGIMPRIKDAALFARQHRVLLLRHQVSGTDIDISLGILPFELEIIERSVQLDFMGLSVRLPTVEDLVILKAVAHRAQDWQDIQGLVESHPELDRERIVMWVAQFAEILDSPKILEDLNCILKHE